MIGKECRAIEPLKAVSDTVASTLLHNTKQVERIPYRNLTFEVSIMPVRADDGMGYILIVFRDISAFVNLEAEFLRKNRELIISNTLSSAFISSDHLDSVFSDLLEKATIISHLNIGWMMLKKGEAYELKVSRGLSSGFKRRIEEGELDSLIKKFEASGSPLLVQEAEEVRKIHELKNEGIAFFALIPLRSGSEVLGCLGLASRMDTPFDFDLASLLSLIGNTLSMIADKVKLFMETQRLAITDGLTGLHNVRHFYEELDKEIARAQRYSATFSLVLFDIDNFKVINDTYGHQAGDEVLQDVAEVLLKVSRKSDVVARYGGEEFITMLPNTPRKEAYTHAHRIKEAVDGRTYLGEDSVSITISGGVASFPDDAPDAKSLLYAADMALYNAKATGKNAVVCYRREK